ncbi:MAG: ABC transporter permease [Gammaproteobacteria bacterium]|nr:ABC transporter permease [Gammaproteobacteria bacterium]MCW9006194.1 ABC transporter permease [Gammaproteobacteria bacterium]
MKKIVESIGKRTSHSIEELGYVSVLLVDTLVWLVMGKSRKQPVRAVHIFHEALHIGVFAIPIVIVLCFSVGMMLAMQGLETLKPYGAQSQVVVGIALSVTREFAALIVGILVAGRSGSAITARIGTMKESQEIDALRVIGIQPVRYLAAPLLVAMMLMVPSLTILGDLAGLFGGALYTAFELNMSIATYFDRSFAVLNMYDIFQGLIKSLVFAVIIVLVGVSNGFQVRGGSEGVGRATTRSVVLSISLIVVADMIFTFFLTR